jgi:hypothetical protein
MQDYMKITTGRGNDLADLTEIHNDRSMDSHKAPAREKQSFQRGDGHADFDAAASLKMQQRGNRIGVTPGDFIDVDERKFSICFNHQAA